RAGNASANGSTSVYFARSAVRPTMSARTWPSARSAVPNGAWTVGRPATASVVAIDCETPGLAIDSLQLSVKLRPLVRLDPHEVGLLAPLQRRHALAGQRAQHDRLGPAVPLAAPPERVADRLHVVAVDLHGVPAEGAPLRGHRLHIQHDAAIGLDAVAVVEGDHVVEAEMGGCHRRLPGRALLELAVRQLDEDAGRAPGEPQAQRHAEPHAEPVPERAARDLDAW